MKKPGLAFALFSGLLCLDPEEEESARHGAQVTPTLESRLCSFPQAWKRPDRRHAIVDARRKRVPAR
jgi:hypothetical protein